MVITLRTDAQPLQSPKIDKNDWIYSRAVSALCRGDLDD